MACAAPAAQSRAAGSKRGSRAWNRVPNVLLGRVGVMGAEMETDERA
ncbi:hypothetical protein BGC_33590 [Burkholderia sp. 3C]